MQSAVLNMVEIKVSSCSVNVNTGTVGDGKTRKTFAMCASLLQQLSRTNVCITCSAHGGNVSIVENGSGCQDWGTTV